MRALFMVGLLVSCTILNPTFDLEETSTGSSTGAGAPTTTPTTGEASGTTVGLGASSTGDPGGTASTGEASTGSTESTADTADTSGDTSGDATTGGAVSCWAQGAEGWPLDGAALTSFEDLQPRDPFITPDGLQLYYIATAQRRPFVSTRAGLQDAFPDGEQQALWGDNPEVLPEHPVAVLGGTELLFVSDSNVYSATATGDVPNKYALPVPLTPPSSGSDTRVSVTADSATMIVDRRDGPPLSDDFSGPSDRFYQYKRAKLQPGSPYEGGADVTPMVGTIGLAICPTLSADGLHLFFSSTESPTLTYANAGDVVAIYSTSRPDIGSPWGPSQPIAITHSSPGIVCPSSVTADGCALVFHRFTLDPPSYTMHLAVRTP